MNRHELEIYLEFYRRKQFHLIPIGSYPDGSYFYMTEKQIRALELLTDDETTQIGYGGSARSGKTIIEATCIIFECLIYPDIGWGLCRKELTTLKRTTLLTLFKQTAFYGLKDKIDYNYNQQLNKITFSNNSDIFLIDTKFNPSDPLNTRFGGLELTKSAIDESNETEEDVVNKVFERTGWRNNEKHGLKRKMFECFNPAKNHIYTRYYLPFRDFKETEFRKFIQALPGDNPNPAVKEWMDDLIKNGDKPTIERQIKGNFEYDDDPLTMIEFDKIMDLWTNSGVPGGIKVITADIAFEGSDLFVVGYWEGLRLRKIWTMPKSDGADVLNLITKVSQDYQVPQSNIIYDADGVGGFIKGFLRTAIPFKNGSKAYNRENYYNLKTQCEFKMAESINNGDVFIECNDHKQAIIKELEQLKKRITEPDKPLRTIAKEDIKKYIGHSPDFMDMIKMRWLLEVRKVARVG